MINEFYYNNLLINYHIRHNNIVSYRVHCNYSLLKPWFVARLLGKLTYTRNEIEFFFFFFLWREKKFDCERMIGKIIRLILILIYPISDNVPNRCFVFCCWATNRWWEGGKRRASEHERQKAYVTLMSIRGDESERE